MLKCSVGVLFDFWDYLDNSLSKYILTGFISYCNSEYLNIEYREQRIG